MPILPAEPDIFPPNLWDEYDPGNLSRRWWCLHAKPRQEKAVARELLFQRVSYYLPLATHVGRTPQGRRIQSIVPLFPGYLFLLGVDEDRLRALHGNRLVRVIEVVDQADLVQDLRQIHKVLGSGLPVEAEASFPVGTHVRVMDGPLAGLTGVVVRRGRRSQFTAIVHFLKQGATVDLQDWQVEPIESEHRSTMTA